MAAVAKPLAHVVVPFLYSEDRAVIDGYATKVQDVIGALAANKPCGWIVDLRGNGGGNMWAMLAGVGPIIGEGELGSTLDKDGMKRIWFYEKGRSGYRGDAKDPYYATTTRPPVVITQRQPVAILIDRDTGSSAEGLAIAFRGRAETRFFAATSTFPFPLSDGAKLFVVTGAMLDQQGNQYPLGVVPDQVIISAVTISSNDPVIVGASKWLSKTKACETARPFRESQPPA